jgi:hypothetical protein
MKIVCVNTSRQTVAVGTALLSLGVSLAAYRNDFDLPHTHSEVPSLPIDLSAISAPAPNVTSSVLYSVHAGPSERRK